MARTKNTGKLRGAQLKVAEKQISDVSPESDGKKKPGKGGTSATEKGRPSLPRKAVTDGNKPTTKKLPKDVSGTSRNKCRSETAELVDEKTDGQASKRKRSTTDRGSGGQIKKARKAKVDEGDARETPFRSSLGGIMTVIKKLNLRESHKRVLKLTPFWAIFEAIIDNKVTPSQCRKSDKMVIEIIESFDPDEEKFRVGKKGQLLDITSADLVSFFGIQGGEDFVSLQYGCKEAVKFVTRRGIVDKRLTTTLVKDLLDEYVKGDETDDVEDVARLLCVYILHTFFFPMGLNVKWVLCERVDDLERMRRYDWNGAILKELMSSIKKYHKEPRKVSGCVMLLLYWLCEHTTLAKPLHPKHPLGIVRWSIPELVNKFKKVWIKDLKKKQVLLEEQTEPRLSVDDEASIDDEAEEKHVVHDTLPRVDAHKSNDMPTPSDRIGNVEGYIPDSEGEMTRTPVGCSISGVQVQDVVSFQDYKDSAANDCSASTVKELRGQIEMKDAEIASLKKHMQDKENMHNRDIEVRDCEIAILNEKILSLVAEGGELWEECAEHVTHAVTQTNRPVPKDKEEQQRSLVKNLKAKTRKGTKREEYVYPQRSKRQIGVPGGPNENEDKAMVDVDAYKPGPKRPASKLDEIKGLQTNKVFRLLSSEDRTKIDQIWKEANNSTNIWCGSVSNCSVFAEDLRCLITENAISGNVIDAYAEFLLMEQELKRRDIGMDGESTQGGPNVSSYAFTSSFLSLIAGKAGDESTKILKHMMTRTSRYRYLLLPINHLFHWTLLVLDTEEGTWKFYNSMRPRKGIMDASLEAARQLKIQIDTYDKSKTSGIFSTQDCEEIEQVVDSPQQAPGSLDCGVIVCYIIRQYFRNEEVGSKLPKSECRRMRADILHTFLNDELNSWNGEKHKDQAEE